MNRSRALKFATIWAASACVAALSAFAGNASAYYEEIAAPACSPVTPLAPVPTLADNGHMIGPGKVVCPFQEDTDHPYPSTASIDAYVVDNSSSHNFSVVACVAFFGVVGTTCGTPATSAGTGFQALHPSKNVWLFNPGQYPFLRVEFPASGGSNEFAGWVVNF